MQLERFSGNPIVSPSTNWWEMRATFNPGITSYNNQVIMLYRAVGGDHLSRFGLATSRDGFRFERFSEPVFEGEVDNPKERLGVEDPRITRIGDTYYIVYIAVSVYPSSRFKEKVAAPSLSNHAPWRVRPSLVTTTDFKSFERKGILLNIDTKDACLFPEKISDYFILYHRIYPSVYLTYSKDLINWANSLVVLEPREGFWDCERVGVGSPPIKTEKGWLVFYHGTDMNHRYSLGVITLDLKDPTKVIYRSSEAILTPELTYEKVGSVPNVVFTCGALERDGRFLVYYGAADRVIGLSSISKNDLLRVLP